jgi:transcriptional regulator with XRE-family HTH domain
VPADFSSAALELANELRERRKAAGFTSQDALARVLNCDRTRVTKAENGQVPTDDLLDAWGEACGFDVRAWKVLARHVRERTPGTPRWFEGWLDAERKATFIRLWHPLLVPGLLQTAEYALPLFLATGIGEDDVQARLATRLNRQEILGGPQATTIVVLLDETVLYRPVGSDAVMAGQLEHLLAVSERRNVMIQVVRGRGGLAGMFGSFDIASASGAPDTMRMSAVADQTTDNPELIREATVIFELIRGRALDVESSRAVIVEAIERWKNQ